MTDPVMDEVEECRVNGLVFPYCVPAEVAALVCNVMLFGFIALVAFVVSRIFG